MNSYAENKVQQPYPNLDLTIFSIFESVEYEAMLTLEEQRPVNQEKLLFFYNPLMWPTLFSTMAGVHLLDYFCKSQVSLFCKFLNKCAYAILVLFWLIGGFLWLPILSLAKIDTDLQEVFFIIGAGAMGWLIIGGLSILLILSILNLYFYISGKRNRLVEISKFVAPQVYKCCSEVNSYLNKINSLKISEKIKNSSTNISSIESIYTNLIVINRWRNNISFWNKEREILDKHLQFLPEIINYGFQNEKTPISIASPISVSGLNVALINTTSEEEISSEPVQPRKGEPKVRVERNHYEGSDVDSQTIPHRRKAKVLISKTDWDAVNQLKGDIGALGEELVLIIEFNRLLTVGQIENANRIRHVSKLDGDGLGYDIVSFDETGRNIYIEVKSTTMNEEAAFFLTQSEIHAMNKHRDAFWIYRVFNLDLQKQECEFEIFKGKTLIEKTFEFEPQTIRVSKRGPAKMS